MWRKRVLPVQLSSVEFLQRWWLCAMWEIIFCFTVSCSPYNIMYQVLTFVMFLVQYTFIFILTPTLLQQQQPLLMLLLLLLLSCCRSLFYLVVFLFRFIQFLSFHLLLLNYSRSLLCDLYSFVWVTCVSSTFLGHFHFNKMLPRTNW